MWRNSQYGDGWNGMFFDPDSYGKALNSHWSGPTDVGSKRKTPQVATIEIEELDDPDDLAKGTKTKYLKDVAFTPPVYRVAPKSDDYLDCTEQDADGNHIITVDTYCCQEDAPDCCQEDAPDSVWAIFSLHGLRLLGTSRYAVTNGCQKYLKVVNRFKVSVTSASVVPYIQLVCTARLAKHAGRWFASGDVVTVFVRHHFMPTVPSPSLLSIRSKAEQTFAPLLPGQRLQIITDAAQSSLEFRLGGAIIYQGEERTPCEKIGTDVVCNFFKCVSDLKEQETVFISSEREAIKTVCVPVLLNDEAGQRYPVIIAPVKTCVIYANNIDGFILRSHEWSKLRVDKGCPLQLVYTMEGPHYEVKVKMVKFRPHFVLERQGNEWLAKSD